MNGWAWVLLLWLAVEITLQIVMIGRPYPSATVKLSGAIQFLLMFAIAWMAVHP